MPPKQTFSTEEAARQKATGRCERCLSFLERHRMTALFDPRVQLEIARRGKRGRLEQLHVHLPLETHQRVLALRAAMVRSRTVFPGYTAVEISGDFIRRGETTGCWILQRRQLGTLEVAANG